MIGLKGLQLGQNSFTFLLNTLYQRLEGQVKFGKYPISTFSTVQLAGRESFPTWFMPTQSSKTSSCSTDQLDTGSASARLGVDPFDRSSY